MPRRQRCKWTLDRAQTQSVAQRWSCGRTLDGTQARFQPRVELAGRLLRHALRYKCAGEARLTRPQGRLGEGEMDDVALREAAAATVRNAVHGSEPFNACRIVAACKREESLAERRRQRHFRQPRPSF